MSDLLARVLGETVEYETNTSPSIWKASADSGQVENALLNLAINARDAMPNGGKLTIECSNVHLDETDLATNSDASAGDYVVLAVSDDGTGMTADVQAHAFEPFFTTKAVGEGSGLGLSMVYGFAKQSGGHVSIYSEAGQGTTVKLYLPRAVEAASGQRMREDVNTIPRGRGEVILVIEDDPDVRDLAVQMLENLNYQTVDVGDAANAHKVLAEGKPVDLVLSDVVLPGGTSGLQFAEEARGMYPSIKIVFMSGYSAEAAVRNGFLGPDQVLLNKPFQRSQLATALREMLD
jgi:CheY-like chemotaxis protein